MIGIEYNKKSKIDKVMFYLFLIMSLLFCGLLSLVVFIGGGIYEYWIYLIGFATGQVVSHNISIIVKKYSRR